MNCVTEASKVVWHLTEVGLAFSRPPRELRNTIQSHVILKRGSPACPLMAHSRHP